MTLGGKIIFGCVCLVGIVGLCTVSGEFIRLLFPRVFWALVSNDTGDHMNQDTADLAVGFLFLWSSMISGIIWYTVGDAIATIRHKKSPY